MKQAEETWMNRFSRLTSSGETLVIVSMCNSPTGASTYEKAIEENPWYFVEEAEYKRKWALVPQEVKDAHTKEYLELIWIKDPNQPYTNGITGTTLEQWEEYYTYMKTIERKKWEEERDILEKELWNKYFTQHDLGK